MARQIGPPVTIEESTQLVPDAVLKALLKIGGWQVGPHVFKP
jgi:hypothetical protein